MERSEYGSGCPWVIFGGLIVPVVELGVADVRIRPDGGAWIEAGRVQESLDAPNQRGVAGVG